MGKPCIPDLRHVHWVIPPSPYAHGYLATGDVSQMVGSLVPDIDFNLSPFCRRPREYLSHLGLCPIIIPERKGRD